MGITRQDIIHGAVLTPLVEHPSFKALNKPDGAPYGVYLLNDDRPFMVKYGRSQNDKWHFTFHPWHISTASTLAQRYPGRLLIILVCYPTEVCAVTWSEFQQCLDVGAADPQGIRCEIPKGGGIRVYGPRRRRLTRVVPRSAFPSCLFA